MDVLFVGPADLGFDGFSLIGAGQDGNGLEAVTRRKIACALDALEKGLGFKAIA